MDLSGPRFCELRFAALAAQLEVIPPAATLCCISQSVKARIAYFCRPHTGGTYSFFRRLRPGLAGHGMDFRCIAPVRTRRLPQNGGEVDEGVALLTVPETLPRATRTITEYLQSMSYDAIMIVPGCGVLASNLPRYLPKGIKCVARVATMVSAAYNPTKAIFPFVDRIVACSDRIASDLVNRYRLTPERIVTIFHGVDPRQFGGSKRLPRNGHTCRLLYLGRLEDVDKGVLLLPDILSAALKKTKNIVLTVAGTGPDEHRLRDGFEQLGLTNHTRMLGHISLKNVPDVLAQHDCFIMPSRFEGCGFALLEAMASGCVPVVSDIKGSIGTIVQDGVNGLTARVGDPQAFGKAVALLATDTEIRKRMRFAARRRIEKRYSLERMANQYAKLLGEVLTQPSKREEPLPISKYRVPRALKRRWRVYAPQGVKTFIRKWAERCGRSV